MRRRLREALGQHGLSLPEYTTLSVLRARGGLSNAQLARRSLITPQSMSEVLASLSGRNLILRQAAPDHGRVIRTELTRAGTRVLAVCDRALDELEREMLQALGERDRAGLLHITRRLRPHARGGLMGNLATLLDEAAVNHGSRTALLHEGISIDYSTLQQHATRCAGLLRTHGIGPGDRVAILLPNVPAFVTFYFGALRRARSSSPSTRSSRASRSSSGLPTRGRRCWWHRRGARRSSRRVSSGSPCA